MAGADFGRFIHAGENDPQEDAPSGPPANSSWEDGCCCCLVVVGVIAPLVFMVLSCIIKH